MSALEFVIAVVIVLAAVVLCFVGDAVPDTHATTTQDRQTVMLHTCFPGGWYDGRTEICRKFKEMVIAEANTGERVAIPAKGAKQ